MTSLIVAQNSQNIIGVDGGIPWHLPEDMKWFKEVTEGKAVIMGRATWESLPDKFRPLPNRYNMVVSRTMVLEGMTKWKAHGCATNIPSALELLERCVPDLDIVFIGGEGIYREAINYVTEIYITHVRNFHINEEEYSRIARFPIMEIDWGNWDTVSVNHFPTHTSTHYRRAQ